MVGGAGAESEDRLDALSVDVGCVRLTERHLHSDPPSAAEIAAATADVDVALTEVAAKLPVASARTLVGLAGSVTTVTAIALGLDSYDPARIHHARIPADAVSAVTAELLRMSLPERASISVMHPGRVDVIGGGALVLDRIVRSFGFAEVVASEHDILDGIAWSLAGTGPPAVTGPVPPGAGWPDDPATPATPVAGDAADVRALAASAGTLAELTARQSVCRACDPAGRLAGASGRRQAQVIPVRAVLGTACSWLGRAAAARAARGPSARCAWRQSHRAHLYR